MEAAGIQEMGGTVKLIDLPDPRPLVEDEVLIEVKAAGVGNWDEVVRTGAWDVGISAPMALGVEAAGTVVAVGSNPGGWSVGDAVMTHPLPLRGQGTWAKLLIAPIGLLAHKPEGATWEEAAAFPVPALTAQQVLADALHLHSGERLLVHGAGGVTGGMLVALGVLQGARVIATAGPTSVERVRGLGAEHVLDYHDTDWPEELLERTNREGVTAAVNAARGGEESTLRTVARSGRLATITGEPPDPVRGVAVSDVYVRPDGDQLEQLGSLLGEGKLKPTIGATYTLARAADALRAAMAGGSGGSVLLTM